MVDGEATRCEPEDWDLVRRCLPDAMQSLDGPSAERVALLLRERLDAGWKPDMLRSILVGNALPPSVRSLSGLVLHRIGQIPVGGAPKRPVTPPRAATDLASEPPEFWAAWMVERTKARLGGDPDSEQSRLWWMRRFPGLSTIPGRVDLEAHLRQELATTGTQALAP